jgi:HTH-type transcriptional regulator/antitoxin HigA
METLKYTLIKSKEQYLTYYNLLEELVIEDKNESLDEIDLLTLLIEKWDNEHNTLNDSEPIEILKSLMAG